MFKGKKLVEKILDSDAESGLAVCYVCGESKKRKNLKYIHRFLSPYVISACKQCRERYRNSKIKRLFVKEME